MRYSRVITVALKLNPTMFQVVNTKSIGAFNTLLGASTKAITILSSKTAEMASLMPTLLGVSPESKDVNFQESVVRYFRNWVRDVPPAGITLETGWDFSLYDPARHDRIMEWAKKNGIDTTLGTIELEKKIFDAMLFGDKIAVHEENLYLYMTPINTADYIAWRLLLNTSTVANRPEDADKSTNIRFYLHSEADAKRLKSAKTKAAVNTTIRLAKLFEGDGHDRIRDILICSDPTRVFLYSKMLVDDLQMEITNLSQVKPDLFNSLFENDAIKSWAQVYKLLAAQVISKDGDRYYDTNRPEIILGSSIEGVIAYLADPQNNDYKSQLFTAYKAVVAN